MESKTFFLDVKSFVCFRINLVIAFSTYVLIFHISAYGVEQWEFFWVAKFKKFYLTIKNMNLFFNKYQVSVK